MLTESSGGGGVEAFGLETLERLDQPHRVLQSEHSPRHQYRERVLYRHPTGPNPLNHRDDFSRPALRHGSLNSFFKAAYHHSTRHQYTRLVLSRCTGTRHQYTHDGDLHCYLS